MGIWDAISGTAGSAKNFFWTSYSNGHDAFTKIDNAVRVDAVQKVNQHFQDEESRAKMGQFATKFAKNAGVLAVRETLKSFPGGGPIYDLVSRSLTDIEKLENPKNQETLKAQVNDYKEKTIALQAEMEVYKNKTKELQAIVNGMEKQLSGLRNSCYQADILQGLDAELSLKNATEQNAKILRAMLIFP